MWWYGLETCLYLYPENEWRDVENALSKANNFTRASRIAKRNFYAMLKTPPWTNNIIALPTEHANYAQPMGKLYYWYGAIHRDLVPDTAKVDADLDSDTFEAIFEQVMEVI